jgi:RNA polymerase sigma factor (sigma-70 family)
VTKIDDSKILELIRGGKDKEVIPLLYKKVLPQVKSYVTKNNGNVDDAFDIFHDALMLFYEQVIDGVFDPKYNVYGYLYKISVYRWINKAKRDRNLVLKDEMPEALAEEVVYGNEQKPSMEHGNLLEKMFSTLGDKCVELLNYTIYSDMLMEDVAIRMGYPSVEAVRMQHMRCKQKLVKELKDNPALLEKLKGA